MRHYNPSITERLFRIFRPKAGDQFSDELSPNVMAVVPVTPITRITRAAQSGATGTVTIYTAPVDKDFYLTGAMLGIIKDAACDASVSINMSVTMEGSARELLSIPILTLTAQDRSVFLSFPFPLKIDRGTSITISGTYAAGNMRRMGNVHGYTEEVVST